MRGWLDRLVRSIELPSELRRRLGDALAPYGFRSVNHSLPDRAVWQGGPEGVPMTVRVLRRSFGVLVFEKPTGFAKVVRRAARSSLPPLGDPAFDAVVAVNASDPARVLATLGPDEREVVRRAVAEGWWLEEGGWVLARSDPETVDVPWILRQATSLGALARLPAPRGSGLGPRLSDPEAGIRQTALSLLLADPAWSGEWRALLTSDDPRVVLRAAVALRDRDALGALARHPDPTLSCDAWLDLLELVGSSAPAAEFEPVLCAVLEASRHRPHPSPDGADGVRLDRILSALARWGTTAALPVLVASRAPDAPLGVRRGAPRTIAAIRARHAPEGGALALAEGGALALADGGDPSGRVALAGPERSER